MYVIYVFRRDFLTESFSRAVLVLVLMANMHCKKTNVKKESLMNTGCKTKNGSPPVTNLPLLNYLSSTFWKFWQKNIKSGSKIFQKCWEIVLKGVNVKGRGSIFHLAPCIKGEGRIKTTKFTTESTADKMLSREQPMLCEIERIFFLLFVCTTHFLGLLVIILAFLP